MKKIAICLVVVFMFTALEVNAGGGGSSRGSQCAHEAAKATNVCNHYGWKSKECYNAIDKTIDKCLLPPKK